MIFECKNTKNHYSQRLILQILVSYNALFYKKSLFTTPYFTCFREVFINELPLGFYCCPIKLFWSEVMFWFWLNSAEIPLILHVKQRVIAPQRSEWSKPVFQLREES